MPSKVTSLLLNTRGLLTIMLVVQVISVIILCYLSVVITTDGIFRHEGNGQRNKNQDELTKEQSTAGTDVVGRTEQNDRMGVSQSTPRPQPEHRSRSITVTLRPQTRPSTNKSSDDYETLKRYNSILTPKSNWSSYVIPGSVSSFEPINVPCARRLELPVTKVYITGTDVANCNDFAECRDTVLKKQRNDYENSETDVQSNFLIGGDGSIFEGLSWTCRVTHFVPDDQSILVTLFICQSCRYYRHAAFNGNDTYYASLQLFLNANIITGNLSPTYQLIPYCCLIPGRNPVRMIYSRLTYFANFIGDECVENRRCQY